MYCGGQGIYLYYLARELKNMGHEMKIISGPPYPDAVAGSEMHYLPSSSSWLSSPNGTTGVDNTYCSWPSKNLAPKAAPSPPSFIYAPLVNFYERLTTKRGIFSEPSAFSIRAYEYIKTMLKQGQKFDIIHDNQSLGWGLLLMKRLNIPVVTTIHHPITVDKRIDIASTKGFRQKWAHKKFYYFAHMQSWVSKRLPMVVTVSQYSSQNITHEFGVSPHKIRVVYNGVDATIFRPKPVPKKRGRLIMVGNTSHRMKGVLFLLKALKLLREEGKEVTLTCVDEVDDEEEYAPKLVRELGLERAVSFSGRVTPQELSDLYSEAEIAVVASLHEGFGLPAVEAMACGLPVVATTAGALPEIVEDGRTGILVPPGDYHNLALAVSQLLQEEGLRQSMGREGLKRVKDCFNWQEAAKNTVSAYQEVIDAYH